MSIKHKEVVEGLNTLSILSLFYRRTNSIKEFLRVAGSSGIVRRYFIMNFFDGAMTMLGILMGTYISGALDLRITIGAGLGACFAMGVSGFFGTYMAEKTETLRKIRDLEKALLSDLSNSLHEKASFYSSLWLAFVDGISPMIAASISMIPLILSLNGLLYASSALFMSIALIMASLFILGAFLGKISGKNIIAWGFQMFIAGILTALIIMLLGAF
ncbi:MAG: hypothetical protein QW265_05070 [Candidatus Bathyarchaeia archaeon]